MTWQTPTTLTKKVSKRELTTSSMDKPLTFGFTSERSFVPTYIRSKTPNHVEVTATELFNGSTTNTKQMHCSRALKVKIAISMLVKGIF